MQSLLIVITIPSNQQGFTLWKKGFSDTRKIWDSSIIFVILYGFSAQIILESLQKTFSLSNWNYSSDLSFFISNQEVKWYLQALFFRDWTKLKPVFTLIIGNIRNFCVGACPWTSIVIGTRSEPEVMKFKSKLKTLSILSKNLSFALDYIIQPNQFDAFDIKHTRQKCSP